MPAADIKKAKHSRAGERVEPAALIVEEFEAAGIRLVDALQRRSIPSLILGEFGDDRRACRAFPRFQSGDERLGTDRNGAGQNNRDAN